MRVGSLSAVVLIQAIGLVLPLPFVIAAFTTASGPEIDWGALIVWAPLSAGSPGRRVHQLLHRPAPRIGIRGDERRVGVARRHRHGDSRLLR